MRIIQWSFPFLPEQGGRETLVDSLSQSLVMLGHEVLVVTGTPSDLDLGLPYRVLRLDPRDPDSFMLALNRFDAEVIHVHNYLHNSVLLLEKLVGRPKIVVTLHNEHVHSDQRLALQRYAWMSDEVAAIVGVSKFVLSSITNSGDFASNECEVIYNGTPVLEERELTGEDVLFLGRMVPEKGLGFLLASFFLVLKKHPNAKLRVLGEGTFRPTFEKLSEDLGIAERTSFIGWQTGSELAESFRSARMVVVPSAWREPFGLTALEGLMHALPVIATDHGALPEIVQDGTNGFLVQPGDVLGLAARIGQLIENPVLAKELGSSGYHLAVKKFSAIEMARKYLVLYARGVNNHGN